MFAERHPFPGLPAAVPAHTAGPASPDLGRGSRIPTRRARARLPSAPGGWRNSCALAEQIYAHRWIATARCGRPGWSRPDGGQCRPGHAVAPRLLRRRRRADMLAAFYNDTSRLVVAPPWELPLRCRPLRQRPRLLPNRPSRLGKTRRPCGPFVIGCASNGSFATGASRPRLRPLRTAGPVSARAVAQPAVLCECSRSPMSREVSKTLGVTDNDALACAAGASVLAEPGALRPPPTRWWLRCRSRSPRRSSAHPRQLPSVDHVWLRADRADLLERLHATHPPPITKQHFSPRPRTPTSARWSSCCRNASFGPGACHARTKSRLTPSRTRVQRAGAA